MEKFRRYYCWSAMISWPQIITAFERHGVSVLFIIGLVIGFYTPFPKNELFLSVTATVSALLASLTGVSISILLSLTNDIADALRKKGYYKILMNYAHTSVVLSLFITLIAISGFLIHDEYKFVYKIVFFGVFLSAFGAFYRVLRLILKIGGYYHQSKND